FIEGLQTASLNGSGLDRITLGRLSAASEASPAITPFERAGLRMYLARGDASEANYADHRVIMQELHPEDDIPSYEAVQRLVGSVTGIHPLRTDMCVNTCLA
ncbi:hypothetical protein LXA43DRAFT_875163, partial [Ganoderma leucocontextum]